MGTKRRRARRGRRNLSKTDPHRTFSEDGLQKKGTHGFTPTESCESDDTEVEVVKSFRAPPALPDPLVEEARVREPMIQTREGHKAVCGDRQREEQRRAE